MNILMRYREAVAFYGLAAIVLTVIAAYPDGGTDNDGAPCCVHPIPSVSPTTSATTTLSSSATPGPVSTAESPSASSSPTSLPASTPPVTLPPSSPPPSLIVPPPSPSPTAIPHNKAKGLTKNPKGSCLVQKKKWLLRVPCPPAHKVDADM